MLEYATMAVAEELSVSDANDVSDFACYKCKHSLLALCARSWNILCMAAGLNSAVLVVQLP